MNKSVLRTMLVIIISMLAFEYILKLFVPEEFVLVISNPNLIKFGNYLMNHKFLNYLFDCLFFVITYTLFTCACSKQKNLKYYWFLIFVGLFIIGQIIEIYNYNLLTPYLVCSMIACAYFNNSTMKDFTIIFIVHTIAQNLSLNIRNLSMYIVSFDVISCFMLTLECYIWLLLFYVLNCYNIKEKEV